MKESLQKNRIVLLGIGHTNAYVLRQWSMNPIADTELVCISDYLHATYSGMLPAVLAQQRPESAMNIDLVKLCASANARLISSPVTGFDIPKKSITFSDRPALSFDLLSIGVGSTTKSIHPEHETTGLVPIKPMQSFLARIRAQIEKAAESPTERPLRLVIIGGGVASVEIALCIPAFVRTITSRHFDITVVTSKPHLAAEVSSQATKVIDSTFAEQGIETIPLARVTQYGNGIIKLDNGTTLEADVVIASTGASAPGLLSTLALPKDKRGFLLTKPTLQSTENPSIFAVGDCGSMEQPSFSKSGVYAVRQGPILWQNLQLSLKKQPLQKFRPQHHFLKLINLGDGRAIAQRGSVTTTGRWAMRWKHRIDDRFISMYQDTSQKMALGTPDATMHEQCRGCGCKLDSESLSAGLHQMDPHSSQEFQDSVVIQERDGSQLMASTDFFTAPFTDAYTSGRIAAIHSLSDLIASGAKPESALSTLVLCEGAKVRQQEQFRDLSLGIAHELKAFGVLVRGGHTIVGPRTEIGLTVIGQRDSKTDIGKHRLDAGEKLFLTKPLGTGVLMAAHMRAQCNAQQYQSLLHSMLLPLHPWLTLIERIGIRAVTDVTGFGLVGHLLEMLSSSHKQAVVELDSIPVLDGVAEHIKAGVQSTLFPDNFTNLQRVELPSKGMQHPKLHSLFDPQTCGGLLFGLATEKVAEMREQVSLLELPQPFQIGSVIQSENLNTQKSLTIE